MSPRNSLGEKLDTSIGCASRVKRVNSNSNLSRGRKLKIRIIILSKRGEWRGAFTLFTFERQDLVMTGFPQGETFGVMDEKGDCLGLEDDTMNLANLLQRYAGKSPQPTEGKHIPPQMEASSLLKQEEVVQPDAANLSTNDSAMHGQMPNDLPTAKIYGALVEHWSEKSAFLTLSLKKEAGSPPAMLNWQEQLASWPEDRHELWAERAAIMEVDGGFSRDEAELQAFICCTPILVGTHEDDALDRRAVA